MVTKEKAMMPDLGLKENAMTGAVEILSKMLADEFLLRVKLRKYHWNVTGPQFHALHEMFEEQYEALATLIRDTCPDRLEE